MAMTIRICPRCPAQHEPQHVAQHLSDLCCVEQVSLPGCGRSDLERHLGARGATPETVLEFDCDSVDIDRIGAQAQRSGFALLQIEQAVHLAQEVGSRLMNLGGGFPLGLGQRAGHAIFDQLCKMIAPGGCEVRVRLLQGSLFSLCRLLSASARAARVTTARSVACSRRASSVRSVSWMIQPSDCRQRSRTGASRASTMRASPCAYIR